MVEILKNTDELDNAIWSLDEDILDLKNELADIYINKAKEINSAWSFLIWDWDSIKDYLVSENLMDRVGDFFKWKIAWDFLSSIDPEMVDYFRKAKEKLDSANTKQQLAFLKNELTWAVDKNNEPVNAENNQDSQLNVDNINNNELVDNKINSKIVAFVPVYAAYKNLKVWSDIKTDEIKYVWENSKYIIDKLETKWNLTKIDKIKDQNGKIVLECKWKTPYINSKIASDLIWFALMYYKKTWSKFIIESAYRTIEHQEDLKQDNKKTWTPTADPGYSWHNLWYSIDISKSSRYSKKVWWISWLKKIAKIFNFHPISSEDWHFDHKEFVDNYYKNKDARLDIAQNLDESYDDNRSMAA